MSDKLEWRNRHALLLQYRTVQEAVSEGKYKITSAVEPFLIMDPMPSEDFVTALMAADRHKEVCEFLAYAMMRRPAVWWGYQVMLSLLEEQAINPPTERDIADIGKPKPFTIPDWAKMPDLEAEAAAAEAAAEPKIAALTREITDLAEGVRAQLPRELVELFDACVKGVDDEFKATHGLGLMDLVKKAGEKATEAEFTFDPKSPIYQEVDKLKAQIEEVRKQTIDTIKSVIPPVDLKLRKKQSDNAMQAVYRWIVAPDEMNSKKAFDIGNECTDQPPGLLALVAAWSFGDMDPTGKTKIPTPPGLPANGLSGVILQAALAKGGTRKLPERYRIYANLGVDVVQGRNLWAESVAQAEPPHAKISPLPPAPTPNSVPPVQPPRQETPPPPPPKPRPTSTYVKWTPPSRG